MAERILIVEDDPATREGLSLLLQTLGYRVTAAPDGATALAALRQEPPDVMLLDLILPGDMSGIQLLQTAREESPQVGAIVMTGFPSAETTVEALRLGAFDYLTKPFDLGRMSSLLTQLVTRQRQERRERSGQECDGEAVREGVPLKRAGQQQLEILEREFAAGAERPPQHETDGVEQKGAEESEQQRQEQERCGCEIVPLHALTKASGLRRAGVGRER